jgi:hypothetical protein
MHHTITLLVAGELQSDRQRDRVKPGRPTVPAPRTTRR